MQCPDPPSPALARVAAAGPRPGAAAKGEGRGGALTVSRAAAAPRHAQGGLLPQRKGRQQGGGARPDASGKTEATAGETATAAAGDPGGRPGRGRRHGRRHSEDAAAGGARVRDRGRRDHQSHSLPRRPRRESGICGQSPRRSRAGRRDDQCRAVPRPVGGRSPGAHGGTGAPFPEPTTPPAGGGRRRRLCGAARGCGAVLRSREPANPDCLLGADAQAWVLRSTSDVRRIPPRLASLPGGRALEMPTSDGRRTHCPPDDPAFQSLLLRPRGGLLGAMCRVAFHAKARCRFVRSPRPKALASRGWATCPIV